MGISLGELDLSDQIQATYDINSMDDFYDISFNKKSIFSTNSKISFVKFGID